MKKFICLLVLFFTAPLSFAVDVEFGGQHRARIIYYQQDSDIFFQRFKFTGTFRPNEMFESNFWLMTNYNWGDNAFGNEIRIYGYGDWKMSDELTVRVGRTPYQIGDGSSVGMNDYEEYPYVMDGVFLSYNTKSLALDLWAAYLDTPVVGPIGGGGAMVAEVVADADPGDNAGAGEDAPETPAAPATAADNNEGTATGGSSHTSAQRAVGISLDVRTLPKEFKMANLFAIGVLNTDNELSQIRVGAGIGGDVAGLDYKLTGTIHGEEITGIVDNYAVDATIGYTVGMDARIHIGGHYESDNYDSFYYSRHGRSGLLDVAQWGNGTVYATAGIAYMPKEAFEVGIIGWYFLNVGTLGKWANQGVNTEDVIEADLYLKKNFAGGFGLELSGGLYDLTNQDDALAGWQVQVNTTFDF